MNSKFKYIISVSLLTLLVSCGSSSTATPDDPIDSAIFEFTPLTAHESELEIIQTGTCTLVINGNKDSSPPTCEGGFAIGSTIERTIPNPAFAVPPPPFAGTAFISSDIITASDTTTFLSSTYAGVDSRLMFDRRVNSFITLNAFLFNSVYADGSIIEVQVNPEFANSDTAKIEAERYSEEIGRLPAVLRKDIQTVWIHQGVQPFGGGNNNILIHTGQTAIYTNDGVLEEILVHEAAHTSLDADHASSSGWLLAQTEDITFISDYAKEYPEREDIAETFLVYLAIRHRSDRISTELKKTILDTVPSRINYFDAQGFDVSPIQ